MSRFKAIFFIKIALKLSYFCKNAKFSSAGGFVPDPQLPATGGFAPRSPLASGGWGLRPQTPETTRPPLRISGYTLVTKWQIRHYLAKSGSKSKIHGPELFITVPYASCVSMVKEWYTDGRKSMWNKRKDCLRMNESVGWTSLRLTIRLLNLKRPQLNRAEQVLTGYRNLQRHKQTITGRAETSLCPQCSLEDETPNHVVGNCKLYQDICVKYFGIIKTTVHNVVTKCNINKLATCLKEAGRLSEFD